MEGRSYKRTRHCSRREKGIDKTTSMRRTKAAVVLDQVHRQELVSAREGRTGQEAMERDC